MFVPNSSATPTAPPKSSTVFETRAVRVNVSNTERSNANDTISAKETM